MQNIFNNYSTKIEAYQLGNEFALKRNYQTSASLILEFKVHDLFYQPKILTPEQAENENFHVVGKLVSMYSDNF